MAKAFVAVILFFGLIGAAFAAAVPAQPKPAKPDWSELKPAQQQVLAPLKDHWGELASAPRQKWVKVANAYPKMKPVEQQRLQERMHDWVKLTSEQRRVARDKYIAIRKLPPAKREEVKLQWKQYQESLAKSDAASSETHADGGAKSAQ
jgi:hypothetical protein